MATSTSVGIAIGSGTIESTVKQIGARIKLSGASVEISQRPSSPTTPLRLPQWAVLNLRLAKLGCTP